MNKDSGKHEYVKNATTFLTFVIILFGNIDFSWNNNIWGNITFSRVHFSFFCKLYVNSFLLRMLDSIRAIPHWSSKAVLTRTQINLQSIQSPVVLYCIINLKCKVSFANTV